MKKNFPSTMNELLFTSQFGAYASVHVPWLGYERFLEMRLFPYFWLEVDRAHEY